MSPSERHTGIEAAVDKSWLNSGDATKSSLSLPHGRQIDTAGRQDMAQLLILLA